MRDGNNDLKYEKEIEALYDEPDFHEDLWLHDRNPKVKNIDNLIQRAIKYWEDKYGRRM